MILGRPFLATDNAFINYRNGMIRLSFGNMTVKLNFFDMRRQRSGFAYMKFSTLNWVGDSIFDYAFDDVFATKYESFLIDDEAEYDVFEFDDLCSTPDCLLTAVCESAAESVSSVTFELKPPLILLSMHS